MRGIGWIEAFMPFGVAVSAALHSSVLGVVFLGWPILSFMTDNDWFSPDEYVRIDVVLYSEKERPEVAKGKGVVSFETETIGKGQAQSSGRAFGPLASHSRVSLTRPNSVARRKSGPDAPSKAAETEKSETTSLARQETAEAQKTETVEARKTKSAKPGMKTANATAKDGKAEKSSDSAAGQTQDGQNDASGADSDAGREGTSSTSAPPSKQADAKNSPAQGQVAKGEETARAQAAQSEALAPDRPKGREDASTGATAEGADADPADGKTPDRTETDETARDGAETGLAEAEAEDGQAESVAKSAVSTGQRTVEAARQSERPTADAKAGTKESTAEQRAEASVEVAAVEPATDAREAAPQLQPRPAAETSDRQREEAPTEGDGQPLAATGREAPDTMEIAETEAKTTARPETHLIRIAAVLDLTPSTNPAFGLSEATPPLPLSTAGDAFASKARARTTETAPEAQKPAEQQEEPPVPSQRAEGATVPVAASKPGGQPPPPSAAHQVAQGSSTQVRNIPLRMLVETMPGLDAKLVQAIDKPNEVLEQPTTARRKKAIDRIAAAAERGYVHAQYGMARRYLLGQGVPRDPAAGAEWLQQAAEQGHAPSQLLLGYLAARGYGRQRNLADAMMWWTLAADAGDPNAASAVRIMEPTLDSKDLLEARRNINSWRAAFGQVEETTSTGGDNTPKSAPLQEAVAAGDLPEVRSVLARGEDAEGRDIDGRTALINAGWRGDPNITETLLEVGADPDIIDHDGKSALIWAASNGNLSVTALLADAGADLDTQDKQGLTALMRAAWNGHTGVVEALLKAGADTHPEDNNGLTALDHATREKYDDIIALLKAAPN